MSGSQCIRISASALPAARHDLPDGSPRAACMDPAIFPGCMFCDSAWYDREVKTLGALSKHRSDELMMFAGSDISAPDELGAEIVFRIENDIFVIDRSCFLFIPAGKAHGLLEVRSLRRPVLTSTCFFDGSAYEDSPAVPTEPAGLYAHNTVAGYHPTGPVPEAPGEYMRKLLWIDNALLPGAPYMESVWFIKPGFRAPEPHVHDFGEVIAFLGTDPERPDELGGEIQFVMDGVTYSSEKSFFLFVPRGVSHSPIIIPRLDRPVVHCSGGGRNTYASSKIN